MITKNDIVSECNKALKESQFFVDIKEKNSNSFIIYVDDFEGISIDECKRINKQICNELDKETEDFALEVSSPGLDKAFKVNKQYLKNIDKNIEVLLKDGIKYIGVLKTVSDDSIELNIKENKKITVEKVKFNDIKSAKSVIKI